MILATIRGNGIEVMQCPFIPSFMAWKYPRSISMMIIACEGKIIYQFKPLLRQLEVMPSLWYFKFAHGYIDKPCEIRVHYKTSRRMKIYAIATLRPRVDIIPDAL